MRDKREYLNPIAYKEMKRRGWSDTLIANEAGVKRFDVYEFKRAMDLHERSNNATWRSFSNK